MLLSKVIAFMFKPEKWQEICEEHNIQNCNVVYER